MINTETFKTEHPTVADQTTWYSIGFVYDKDPATGAPELWVRLDGNDLTWGSDYTVGVQGLQLTSAPVEGLDLVITRSMPLTQEQDYQTGLISAEQIEHGFDRSVMRDQYLKEDINELLDLTEDNFDQLSDVAWSGDYNDLSNKPSAGVSSVNGETGDVVIEIPTKTSDLTNDSGFITTETLSDVALSGDYNDLSNKPVTGVSSVNGSTGAVVLSIPTKTSDLTNDSGFITTETLADVALSGDYEDLINTPTLGTMASENSADYTKTAGLATVATTGNYNDLSNKPVTGVSSVNGSTGAVVLSIPTKTSDLTNDSGFTTINDSSTSANVTWSASKLNTMIGNIESLLAEI